MSKFIGRRASPCRKCSGVDHYQNRMGGLVCVSCSPPKTPADDTFRLTIEGGVWIDPANRFDMIDATPAHVIRSQPVATGNSGVTSPRAAGHSSQPNGQQQLAAAGPTGSANGFKTHWLSRGPGGEFSEAELGLFGSPLVWDQPGECVTLVGLRIRRVGPGLTPERDAGGSAKVSGLADRARSRIVGTQKSAIGLAGKLPFCST